MVRHYLFQITWPSFCCILWLLIHSNICLPANAKRPNNNNKRTPPNNGNDLNDWIRARCGSDDQDDVAVWVYEGALFDPLEGRKIATVEGVELVRCVARAVDPTRKQDFAKQCGDLEVGPLLSHENATFDQAATILSRKLFCYQSPDQPDELLSSIKLRPNAPLRTIPTRQAVATYDTATTLISRGKELIAHTEWPDRQSIWGRATLRQRETNPPDEEDSNNFEFTVYARQKAASRNPEQLFDLTQPPADPNDSSEAVASPRRVKLIEFGSGSSRSKHKFGARESYSYSNIGIPSEKSKTTLLQRLGWQTKPTTTPPCQVRYSRYGEGPPFLGPARVCTLELQGRRIQSLQDLPPLTASLIAQRMTTAFNTTLPLDQFRSNPPLQIQPGENEKPDFWLPDYLKEKGMGLVRKWRN